ncbi:MAG: aspartyl-tRNA(Asn)/glutamyl-tRNA(Gln) amidotransferase subunit A [Pseudohongiellaceae bacterium]|jgi:aspartyl-tRNA(Asn)/glutamyl-tRNA(Gln) amidotransferase subunit A
MSGLSASSIAQQVRAGELDPLEIAESAMARLVARDPAIHAYLDRDFEFARQCAATVAEQLARHEDPGPLAGVPISLKDNLAVQGRTLTAGSRVLAEYRAPYSSTVAKRLLAAGAVLLGRTNLDEFAMGSSTEHSAFGPTANPWNTSRVPGGSSGGSAAAVAAGIVPVALGSETGGSIRQPASFCGVTGFKPTYGAVSRHGLVAFASSLDQLGPITAHAADSALVFDVIAGHDPRDATTYGGQRPSAVDADIKLNGLRIVFPDEFIDADSAVLAKVDEGLTLLESAGASIARIAPGRLTTLEHSLAVYSLVSACEASSNLARFHTGSQGGQLFGHAVKRRILLGTFALSEGHSDAWYEQAIAVRKLLTAEFDELFQDYDLIATPTCPTGPFPFGEHTDDPYAMARCDVLTAPACLAGLPSISVPCGLAKSGPDKGLPVGLCLTGPRGHDHRVLAAARAFEALRGAPERSPLFEGNP